MVRRFVLMAGVVLGALASGCDDGTAAAKVDYAPLLATLTDDIVLPQNAAAVVSADAFATAMAALDATPDATTLAAAQMGWRAVRADFRKLDAFHFGPIADNAISDRIDVGPANGQGLEAIIAGATTLDATYVGTLGGKEKGFLAAEYLIFASEGSAAALAKLQGDGAPARRRHLARLIGDEIVKSVHEVADAWDPAKGNYAAQVKTAGNGSTRYPRQRGALDDYVGGVGYALELVVGIRLAFPLGRKTTGTPDASLDPTPNSDNAVADMEASLASVLALYQNNGFSTRVRVMSTVLDERALSQHSDCATKISAIPAPFAAAVENQTAVVQTAYDACKVWKGTWNTDVTSALGATLRPTDNDGD